MTKRTLGAADIPILLDVIEEAQWSCNYEYHCPWCGALAPSEGGSGKHKSDCHAAPLAGWPMEPAP